jgi:spore germination protein KB
MLEEERNKGKRVDNLPRIACYLRILLIYWEKRWRMNRENISLIQLIMFIVIYLFGSAIVIGAGKDAGEDAWLAMLMATFFGVGIIYFYYSINACYPNKNLFEIMECCFSRPVAIILSFIYIIYFLYLASRVIRDFTELISAAILPLTPIEVTSLAIMLVIAYILYLGLEVLGRVSEIFIPYLVGFLLILAIFLASSGEVHLKYLQPVFSDGFKDLIKALFPTLITFPFGELVVFTVIFASVSSLKKAKKISMIGVLIAGSLLTFGNFLNVITLGAETMKLDTFPGLSVARRVAIGNFIERIDAIIVFIMMLGILVKVSIYLYSGLKGLEYIFRIPYRYFTFPIAMIVSPFSVMISSNYAEHIEEGLVFVPYFMHIPFQFLLPSLLLIVSIIKTRINNSKQNGVKI